MLDWLIVGGGIHGTSLAFRLIERQRTAPDRVRVLDPHAALLARWGQVTANTGMTHLRSPGVHHLHYDPFALRTFALAGGFGGEHFIPTYHRPSLALFTAHSRSLIDRARLDRLHLVGAAAGLRRIPAGWRVESTAGGLDARRVVLALGASDHPHWPAWARELRAPGFPINHLFDPAFVRADLRAWEHCVVIGGGISAAQTALVLAKQQPGTVTLLHAHPPRVAAFDSDPCWVTRLCLDALYRTVNPQERRVLIQQARQRGSMPPDVAAALRTAIQRGEVRAQLGVVVGAEHDAGTGRVVLRTATDTLTADQVILATGTDTARPGGAWLEAAIEENALPLAPDGYPMVDRSLCWADGLSVMGPLAELEIGPVSRNIIGARLAAERIALAGG